MGLKIAVGYSALDIDFDNQAVAANKKHLKLKIGKITPYQDAMGLVHLIYLNEHELVLSVDGIGGLQVDLVGDVTPIDNDHLYQLVAGLAN